MSKKPATQKGSKKVTPSKDSKRADKTMKEEKKVELTPKQKLEEINKGLETCSNYYGELVRKTPIDADGLTIMLVSARIAFIREKQQLLLIEKQQLEEEILK